MKAVKLLAAILLLPACAAVTMSAWKVAAAVSPWSGGAAAAFWSGYALWLLVFACLPKPMRTYVLGHELTHALWALMMGARVSGLKVRKTGGRVRTSKTNWLIALAPYFFPFYAMLFIAAFFVAHTIWGLERQAPVLFFFVGLGWSFHITFTLMMLLTVRQPDVQSQGAIFSAVLIYIMNLLAILLTVALLSRTVTVAGLAQTLGSDLLAAYVWTLDKLAALWHHAGAFLSRLAE